MSTATVKRMDLAQTTPVHGMVGYAGPHTIVQPAGPGPQAIDQAQQSVAAGAGEPHRRSKSLGDTNLSDAQSAAQARQALATAQATLASDTTHLQADQVTLTVAKQQAGQRLPGERLGGERVFGPGGVDARARRIDRPVATVQETVASDQQKVTVGPGCGPERPGAGHVGRAEGRRRATTRARRSSPPTSWR